MTEEELQQRIIDTIESKLETFLTSPEWLSSLETQTIQVLNTRVSQTMATLDVNSLIAQAVERAAIINKDIGSKMYPGIQDTSSSVQLSLLDGAVVVENDLVVKNFEVVDNTKINNIEVTGDLNITGTINTGDRAWQSLVDDVRQHVLQVMPGDWIDTIKSSVTETLRKENPLKDAPYGTKLDANLAELLNRGISTVLSEELPKLLSQDTWQQRLDQLVIQTVNARVGQAISTISIDDVVLSGVKKTMEINKNIARNVYPGIEDVSQDNIKQLSIMDGAVVVENDLFASNLEVVKKAKVQDLEVAGELKITGPGWSGVTDVVVNVVNDSWNNKFKTSILEDFKQSGIEASKLLINGAPAIDGPTLHGSILNSKLTSVGTLDSLEVKGPIRASALYSNNTRVGINTENPEMALSVWDEEVSIGIGKSSKNQAYIGTTRSQNLVIGINSQGMIELDKDIVTIKKLRVGKNQLGYGTEVPNWSGTKGDIIFNTNFIPGSAFAWMCLGAFKWQAIKAN